METEKQTLYVFIGGVLSDEGGKEWEEYRESNEQALGPNAKIEYISNPTWNKLMDIDWEAEIKEVGSLFKNLTWQQGLCGLLLGAGGMFVLDKYDILTPSNVLKFIGHSRSSVFDNLHDQALPLAETIHETVKDHPGPVVLVGHSHGAWAIREYLRKYELPTSLETYALGSPVFVDQDTLHFVHSNDLIPIVGPFRDSADWEFCKTKDLGEFSSTIDQPLAPHLFENYIGPFQEYIIAKREQQEQEQQQFANFVVGGIFVMAIGKFLQAQEEKCKEGKEDLKDTNLFAVAEKAIQKRRECKKRSLRLQGK